MPQGLSGFTLAMHKCFQSNNSNLFLIKYDVPMASS